MPSEPDRQGLLFRVEKPERHAASYAAVKAMEPLSRNTDSLGSFKAADRLGRTGLGSRKRLAVYHALRQHQGSTSAELAQAAGLDRHDVARRLPELEKAGWVSRGGVRQCTACGLPCVTWFVTRRWLESPAVPRDCEPQAAPGAATPATGTTTSARPRSATTVALGPIPASVITPAERAALRRRLAAEGPDHVRRFLRHAGQRIDRRAAAVESGEGGGK